MVDLVPKAKIQSSGIVDALLIGTVKAVVERGLMPVIGNGNVTSGAIKLIGGGALSPMVGGKAGNIISSAFVIDGVEDIVQGLIVPMIYGAPEQSGAGEANW